MSTIFPLSASVNQIFDGYRFNGEKWEIIGVDLTADYPEIIEGKISASVIPDTFATVSYVDQEVGNIDLSPYLTASVASSTYLTQSSASSTYATKTEVENIDLSSASAAAVAAIVDSAPETLNTLNELAAALNDDNNFAGTVATSLASKLDILSASTTYATKTELQELDLLPDQTGNDGKYLTTTGASAFWGDLDIPPSAVLQSASPVGAEAGQIWVDSNASASYLNTNDFLLKADIPYTPVYIMNIGASASRPSPATNGMFRFNTDIGYPEWYDELTSSWWKFSESKSVNVDYLVVAGGGGGGNSGGGGAGGYLSGTQVVQPLSTYTITVGSGGTGRYNTTTSNGSNSVFSSFTSIGGGGGGAGTGQAGASGGSGGGSGYDANTVTRAAGTSGQGNSGGRSDVNFYGGGGGGGGAGASGSDATTQSSQVGRGGNGGIGVPSSITGVYTYYAGGGGGGCNTNSVDTTDGGLGGSGGGGAGARTNNGSGTAGTTNTGGGGGGGDAEGIGANGGSGVVIIAYPNTYPNLSNIDAGLTYTLDTTTRSGYKVYKFTQGTGTVTFA